MSFSDLNKKAESLASAANAKPAANRADAAKTQSNAAPAAKKSVK